MVIIIKCLHAVERKYLHPGDLYVKKKGKRECGSILQKVTKTFALQTIRAAHLRHSFTVYLYHVH